MSETQAIVEFADKCQNAKSDQSWLVTLLNEREDIEKTIDIMIQKCDKLPDDIDSAKTAKDKYESARQHLTNIGEISQGSSGPNPDTSDSVFLIDGSPDIAAAETLAIQLGTSLLEGEAALKEAQAHGQQIMEELASEREKVMNSMAEVDEAFKARDYKKLQEQIEAFQAVLDSYKESDVRAQGFKYFQCANVAEEEQEDRNLVGCAEKYAINLWAATDLINNSDVSSIGYEDLLAVITERLSRLVDRYEDWADMWKAATQNMSDDHKILSKIDKNLDDRAAQFQKERNAVADLAIDAESALKGSAHKDRQGRPRFKTCLATLEAAKSKMLKHGMRPSTSLFFQAFGFWSNADTVDRDERRSLQKDTDEVIEEVLLMTEYNKKHDENINTLHTIVIGRGNGYADINTSWRKSSSSDVFKHFSLFDE